MSAIAPNVHNGINCDNCMAKNFTGTRYKCKVCSDFDLCEKCFGKKIAVKSHLPTHKVEAFTEPVLHALVIDRICEDSTYSSGSIISSINYKFDNDGDFIIWFISPAFPQINFYVVIITEDKSSNHYLTWRETRAIYECLKLASRGSEISPAIAESWVNIITSKVKSSTVVFKTSEEGKKFSLLVRFNGEATKEFPPGRIAHTRCYSRGGFFVVKFATDIESYEIVIYQTVTNSLGKLQALAFGDALYFSEPGDKMDDSIFLQICAHLRNRYNVVGVYKDINTLQATIFPTSMSLSSTGIEFRHQSSLIELPPAPTNNTLQWSEATTRRIARLHSNVTCDGCGAKHFAGTRYKCNQCDDYDLCQFCFQTKAQTKSHIFTHKFTEIKVPNESASNNAGSGKGNNENGSRRSGGDDSSNQELPAVIRAKLADGSLSLLQLERLAEEARIAGEAPKALPIISSTLLVFDDDGDVRIVLRTPSSPNLKFILCVQLTTKGKINWREGRAIRDCLKLGERGTKLSETDFRTWEEMLKKVHGTTTFQQTAHFWAITIKPQAVTREWGKGYVQRVELSLDKDNDLFMTVSTDIETFVVIINLVVLHESLSKLQSNACREILPIFEQGEKMDESIFLQHCSRLREKFNIVTMLRHQNIIIAHLIPSRLTAEAASMNQGTIVLPDVTEGALDWSPQTKQRVSAGLAPEVRVSIVCDGCSRRDFQGKRYNCVECTNYTLCQECFDKNVETKQHKVIHAIRVVQPPAGSSANSSGGSAGGEPFGGGLPSYDNGVCRATELLKRSGQADVYKGQFQKNGKSMSVAIKVYHTESDWRSCKDELISLIRISGHRNVMEVLDFYEVPKPCLIMPLVEGMDLNDYLSKHGKMSFKVGKLVLAGIAEGLAHLHANGIIHRDMKSPNVLIEMPSHRAVIIDLGLGKAVTTKSRTMVTASPRGTILWMSPEMLCSSKWSDKIDIYALGIIMWEVFTAGTPYEDMLLGGIGQLIHHIENGGRPPSKMILKVVGVTQGHVTLMEDSWHQSPDKRPTAAEFLKRITVDANVSPTAPAPVSAPASPAPAPVSAPDSPAPARVPAPVRAPAPAPAPTTGSNSKSQKKAQPSPTASTKQNGKKDDKCVIM